jgi:hypothetical protein
MYNDTLTHYGVLGMKWGQRKAQRKAARATRKAEREQWSDDATNAARIRTKKMKQMSNAELRALNERLQLERQYKDLNQKKKSAGQKFVNDVMVGAAKDTAKSYVSKYMKKGINAAVQKALEK